VKQVSIWLRLRACSYACVFVCLALYPRLLHAQIKPPAQTKPAANSKQTEWVPVPSERFDIVFNRTFFAGASSLEDPVLNQSSGTTGIHYSFNVLFNAKYSVRVQPGVDFVKYNVEENNGSRTFQPVDSAVARYKLRAFYAECPVLVGIAFRDSNQRLNSMLEVGLSLGYLIASSIKYDATDPSTGQDLRVRQAGRFYGELERLRIGAVVKFSYRFIGMMVYYRLNDVFKSEAVYESASGPVAFPKLPGLEIGITLNI
jgi:Outer membrane protein beta-barrel domain